MQIIIGFFLGLREDNVLILRRISLSQETVLGNPLGNILTVTGKYTYNKLIHIYIF